MEMDYSKNCRDCIHSCFDMDEVFCSHEISFQVARPFGLNLNAARREGNFCGPNAKYYEIQIKKADVAKLADALP